MPSLFDLHCSTGCRMYKEKLRLDENTLGVDLKKLSVFDRRVQFFSFSAETGLSDDEAFVTCKHALGEFARETEKNGEKSVFCTSSDDISSGIAEGKTCVLAGAEDARILGRDLSRIETLYGMGVRTLTLFGRGENAAIGGFANSDEGLTQFGFEVLRECERLGITVDASNAAEKGFWDIAGKATKPFIVSRSNSALLCPHKGNISDIQYRTVASCGGLVGVSLAYERLERGFYDSKNAAEGEKIPFDEAAALEAVCRHIEHFAEIDERAVCLGMGLDETEKSCIEDVSGAAIVHQALTNRGLDERTADKIFFGNAFDFFVRNLSNKE